MQGAESSDPSFPMPKFDLALHMGSPKVHVQSHISGMANTVQLTVFNNSLNNLKMAVAKRVLLCKQPDGSYGPVNRPTVDLGEALHAFVKILGKHTIKPTRLTLAQNAGSYRGSKGVIYRGAEDEINRGMFSPEDVNVYGFTKKEAHMEKADRTAMVPRMIHPRHPRYNLMVGRFTKPAEKAIYSGLNRLFLRLMPHEGPESTLGRETVAKGLNASDLGRTISSAWGEFAEPVGLGLDASRADQCFGLEFIKWMALVYKEILKPDDYKKFIKLYRMQYNTKVVAKCPEARIKYKLTCLASGDMDTSLKMVVAMCGMIWTLLQKLKIRARVINCGDDSVIICERVHAERLIKAVPAHFKSFGFNMKVERPAYRLEHIEFCQTRPVYDGAEWIMVRNFKAALSKDVHSIKPWASRRVFQRWSRCVGLGGLALAGGIPIFDAFYRSMVRAGGRTTKHVVDANMESSGLWRLGVGLNRNGRLITTEARVSFYYAFDVTPAEQVLQEEYYDSITPTFNTPVEVANVAAYPGDVTEFSQDADSRGYVV